MFVLGVLGDEKKASGPLDLELQIFVKYHVDAET